MRRKTQEWRLKRVNLFGHATSFHRPLLLFSGSTDFHGNVHFTVMVEIEAQQISQETALAIIHIIMIVFVTPSLYIDSYLTYVLQEKSVLRYGKE